jgi:hypothetical protein
VPTPVASAKAAVADGGAPKKKAPRKTAAPRRKRADDN